MHRFITCLLAVFSIHAQAGVILQNPPRSVHLMMNEPSVVEATGDLDQVQLGACDGSQEIIEVQAQIDLVTGWSTEIPSGDWCNVSLSFSSEVTLRVVEQGTVLDEHVSASSHQVVLNQDALGLYSELQLQTNVLNNTPIVIEVDPDE